ncbi:hypothetical protein BS47DRAFT_1367375 [Hydnum rufescens UP504]|uniref:Uncharacterized protein n=1 Tax=Hydnum rufescens UP504 TaxID=1448309 RepID=A0A9P6DKU5_9AGAM|nr:hypothetical protein BS47DRAFT_1367375 [Hydnum rufescens UP504]
MPNNWPYFVEGSSFASFMDLPKHGAMVLEVQSQGMSLLVLQLIYIVSLGWSNHCDASEPPTPQPEDFQMRGTPQSSIPQSSIPQSSVPQSSVPSHPSPSHSSPVIHPPVIHPQISIATIVITAIVILSIIIPSIVIPAIIIPQALFLQSTSLPLVQPSPHPSVSSTMLLNRIVSLEIELQEVTEVLEVMTQSRDEVCLVLGNILVALNTIVENTQLGGT